MRCTTRTAHGVPFGIGQLDLICHHPHPHRRLHRRLHRPCLVHLERALQAYLIEVKGHSVKFKMQIQWWFYNNAGRNEEKDGLGVSSFGSVDALVKDVLNMDKVLSSPEATIDTPFALKDFHLDPEEGRVLVIITSIKGIMTAYLALYRVLLCDFTYKMFKEKLACMTYGILCA